METMNIDTIIEFLEERNGIILELKESCGVTFEEAWAILKGEE